MHKLSKLIEIWKAHELWIEGESDEFFSNLVSDTRKLGPNQKNLFFARKGSIQDGHQFLNELESSPAVAGFVAERRPDNWKSEKPFILVRDSKLAMALAAKWIFDDPSKDLYCVGITGTNGKTTSSYLVKSWLEFQSLPSAISGTVFTGFGKKMLSSSLTTPDFSEWQSFLSQVRQEGARAFTFEASSHALDQGRLLGIELDAALFTNLSSEHLDYHGNMEDYFAAKKKLFTELLYQSKKKNKKAVCPADGAYGSRLIEELKILSGVETLSWGYEEAPGRHLQILEWETSLEGSRARLSFEGQSFEIHSPLVGKFNIENIVGVAVLALASGTRVEALQSFIENFSGVPGRLERIESSSGAKAFVDYAHTPDALENILSTLRPLCQGELRVVFGCGGDRDKSKRPMMAQVVELYADRLYLTSDNPRSEDPLRIIEDMIAGLQKVKAHEVEVDRRKAIEKACHALSPQDVLVVAGKGHEKYQQFETEKVDFDDVQVVREFIN